ncbi:uncharacterized protein A4U43_C05F1150 [Asparagus officinalis]|uniref:BRCT domain-containing protein n=1 Tax=Asparagus officinalis TaxID=4686 RepID=A0A5P1ENG4_ASPOF|nr:uncharacterized protein LOC109844027 [Asparagus officinalis]ONK67545.1 uncharacterized protein A4U43_C05F1150 [Asparagus officinalis]
MNQGGDLDYVPDSDEEIQQGFSTRRLNKVCVARKATDTNHHEISVDSTTKSDELDHELEIPGCSQSSYSDKSLSRVNRSRIRKLYNEEVLCETDNRFIGSQEPGELSQAIAMNVVEKLVCDNDEGSCQAIDSTNVVGLNSPPISSVRGAQHLAKWVNHRSSVRELRTFDWVESVSNEGGNDSRERMIYKKREKLCCSDIRHQSFQESPNSGLIPGISSTNKIQISETEGNDPLEVTDADIGDADQIYDIGPSTQMAAEAMEALVHGSPLNHGLGEVTILKASNLNVDSNIGVSLEKRISSTRELESISICCKRRKSLSGELNKGTSSSSVMKEVEKTSIPSKAQTCSNKRFIEGNHPFKDIPVAPRTKVSKCRKVSNSTKKISLPMEKDNPRDNMGDDKFAENTSRFRSLKRRDVNISFRVESRVVCAKPTNIVQPSERCDKSKVIFKSFDDILGSAKRKKRSASVRNVSSVSSERRIFSLYDAQDGENNAKLDIISPIRKAQETQKISCSKYTKKVSTSRELLRLEATEQEGTWLSKDSRRRKDMSKVCILFSNHLDVNVIKRQKKILARFGAPIASSMEDATHFIADRFARTKNMLEAMAMGKPVVTKMWLDSCARTSYFIDEKNYLLRDLKKEKEIGFSMPVSLARACQQPLLQGRRVLITPNVKPSIEIVRSLVKAAHGQVLSEGNICKLGTRSDNVPDDLLLISCEEDYAACTSLIDNGVKVFSSDLLLNGIIIQKLEFDRYQLFVKRVK